MLSAADRDTIDHAFSIQSTRYPIQRPPLGPKRGEPRCPMRSVKTHYKNNFAIIIIFFSAVLSATAQDSPRDLANKFNNILIEYFSIACASKNPEIAKRANAANKLLQSGKVKVNLIFPNAEKPLSSAEFCLDENTQPALTIKPALIHAYKNNKSLVFAMLMHEIDHIYNYGKDPDWFFEASKNDPLEKYLFEMDAAFIEALFLRDESIPRKWKLSKFENYLIDSFNSDNLASYSFVFQMVDIDFIYTIYKIPNSKLSTEECCNKMLAFGESFRQSIESSGIETNWKTYMTEVSARSYLQYAPRLAARILTLRNSQINPKDSIDSHIPNYDKIILAIQDDLKNSTIMNKYRSDLVEKFNLDILP